MMLRLFWIWAGFYRHEIVGVGLVVLFVLSLWLNVLVWRNR